MSSSEVSNFLQKILKRIKDVIEKGDDSVSIDDNNDTLTIDTEEGPIDVLSSGSGSGSTLNGESYYNKVFSVAEGTSETVVTHISDSNESLAGFTGNGESDGIWTIYINNTEKASQWTNQSAPNADFYFDDPINLSTDDEVKLKVENIGLGSADYSGTVLVRLE